MATMYYYLLRMTCSVRTRSLKARLCRYHESNANYAQGGVSAVLCPVDSVESHLNDTIVAGAYLCDEDTVRVSFNTIITS
jgi:aspartate oxidase